MKNTNYAALSLNDIIFEGRNKAYGAYELRQSYDRRIRQAMLGTISLVALLCSYQSLMAHRHPVVQPPKVEISQKLQDVKIETIEMKKPELPKPKAAAAPQGVPDPPTVRSTAILIPAATEHTTDSIPRTAALATAATGDENKNGTTPGTRIGTPDGDLLAMNVTKPTPPAVETVDYASVMPEYPGGESAMMQYISDNIRYPEPDLQMDIQGRVMVGFTIDENGNVNDIHIIRGLSRTLDEESIRVVRKLKRFTPGSQGGRPVRVRFKLPLSYRLS